MVAAILLGMFATRKPRPSKWASDRKGDTAGQKLGIIDTRTKQWADEGREGVDFGMVQHSQFWVIPQN